MYSQEIESLANASRSKMNFMKTRPLGYFLMSMLAGVYVGFGIILIFSVGGMLSAGGFIGTKIVMGVSFGIALSLVVMAGSELFTGNNLVMAAGLSRRQVSILDAVKLWIFCWVGNLAGSVLLAVMYVQTGLATGAVGEFIAKTSAAKMATASNELFFRGILCNMLVCLAVWCGNKMKSESGKLIMIFWCLFAFITSGYEHSIANMTLLAIGVLNPLGEAISIGGYFYNLFFVTIGNMVGGILFVAVPYLIATNKKSNE